MIDALVGAGFSVKMCCRVLGGSSPGYYRYRARPLSRTQMRRQWLTGLIREVHEASRGTYGSRRIHAELTMGMGVVVSERLVAVLMSLAGIRGLPGPAKVKGLERVDHQELARIALGVDEPGTGTQVPPPLSTATNAAPSKSAGYRVHISDEVEQFWEEFSATYQYPVAPIALIMPKYSAWRNRQAAGVLPQIPEEKGNLGLLAREIKTLALKDDEWVRIFYRQDCSVLAAANPRTPLEARLRRRYPYTRAAYARQNTLAQHVELIA